MSTTTIQVKESQYFGTGDLYEQAMVKEAFNKHKRRHAMPPKNEQLNKMIDKAETLIEHCQEQLAADPPPDDTTAANLMDTIDAQMAKIERLQSQMARLDAIKKGKK